MTPARRLALLAAGQAGSTIDELAAFAVGDDDALFATEVPERLADALKMAIEAIAEDRALTEDQGQMLAACVKFLDGWA
jgi:hypothetical protein